MTTLLPQTKMAVSKGGTLTLGSKHQLITAADSVPPASQATTITSQGRELTPATISEPLMAQSVDELKLPPHLSLCESGLCQSECVKALQQKVHNPAHVAWDTRTKRSVSALITLFSCQPCHCSRSWATNTCNVVRSHDQTFWRIKWTLQWYYKFNPLSVLQYRYKFQQSLHLQRSNDPWRRTPIHWSHAKRSGWPWVEKSLDFSPSCRAHGNNFYGYRGQAEKNGTLRSLTYIYSNPLRFPISSLGLPNFPSQKSWEGALAKYTADAWTSIRQNLES